jgi:hypothetical protein
MKKYILIVAAFFTAGISGCKKDYLSLEVNPNTPSVGAPALVLAGALNNSSAIVQGTYPAEYGVWAGYYTTSGNYVPNQTVNQYQLTSGSLNGEWGSWYATLTNFNTLQKATASDATQGNFTAICMIMKAYGFQHLVDAFNDIPYSQAFQPSTILFPAYDKGIDIYHDLGKQLDAAIALINKSTGAVSPGSADIVFGGNMAGWKKFANSIKLRLAMRVSTKLSTDALVTDLASTQSEGYLDGATQAIANPGYSNIAGKQNPFWANYGIDASGNPVFGNVYYRANDFAVKMLNNFSDPRLTALYAPTTGAYPAVVIHGNVFGDTSPALGGNPVTSAIGPGLLQSASQSAVLFSGAESLFLQAEAALDGAITGTPQTLYEAAITASFVESHAGGTITPAATATGGSPQTVGFTYVAPSAATSTALAVTYYSQDVNNVGWVASGNKEQAIITQKWIALSGLFAFEAFNEYRRTGYPVLPTSADPAKVNPTLPTRVLYPGSELSTNPTNLGKEGTISPFTSKIFWAQ